MTRSQNHGDHPVQIYNGMNNFLDHDKSWGHAAIVSDQFYGNQ